MSEQKDSAASEGVPEIELEPCPFCPDGGQPYFTKTVNGTNMAYVGCGQCGVQLKAQVQFVTSREDWRLSKDIIEIWNFRPVSPVTVDEAARRAADKVLLAIHDHYVTVLRTTSAEPKFRNRVAEIITSELKNSDSGKVEK